MKERTQRILRRLLTVNTFFPTADLSKEFHISERTLRNELADINDFLEASDLPVIIRKRGKGLKLELISQQRGALLEQLDAGGQSYYYSPEERFLILLFQIADSSTKTWLYEMETQLQISKSTLDEDMRKLRHFLKDYGIKVVSLPKQGVVFQGDERSLRTMIYDVINNFTDIENLIGMKEIFPVVSVSDKIVFQYLSEKMLQVIVEKYDEIFRKSHALVNQIYRNQIILFLSIWIKRLQGGNTISELSKAALFMKESDTRDFVDQVCREFAIVPSINELKYIIFTIDSFNSKDMNNYYDWVTAQLLAIQLIDHVEKYTEIPFSKEEEDLYEGLYKHITGLLSRVKNDVQIFNPLKKTIQESYADIYLAVKKFSPKIEDYTKKKLSGDEIGFLTIYFSTSESQIRQKRDYCYRAVVVCNHGVSTGKLLAANLKEQFNIEIVAVLSSYELSFIEKLDVDLIFSTISIDYSKKPLLLLNPILRQSDKEEIRLFLEEHHDKQRMTNALIDSTSLLQSFLELIVKSSGNVTKNIYAELEKIFNENNLKINKREIQPMLQDILKDSDILIQAECTDWRAAIAKVAQPLIKDKVVEERYINAMIHSVEEHGPYIVIGKNFALAHARPEEGVNQLGISAMTLKDPVKFGHPENDPVKIIFCLAAVDSYSHLNVMKNLIELINDEPQLEKLSNAGNIKEFNAILYREEVEH